MKGRCSGRDRGRGSRQPLNEGGNRKPAAEPNHKQGIDPNVQVTTAIQRITDLLAQIVDRQSQNPINYPENHLKGKDRTLE